MSVTCDRSMVFLCSPVSSTNKTDRHDITEILLKVVLNTIKQTKNTYSQKHVVLYYMFMWSTTVKMCVPKWFDQSCLPFVCDIFFLYILLRCLIYILLFNFKFYNCTEVYSVNIWLCLFFLYIFRLFIQFYLLFC